MKLQYLGLLPALITFIWMMLYEETRGILAFLLTVAMIVGIVFIIIIGIAWAFS